MTWNPFHQRGETPRDRAEQLARIERAVRKVPATSASDASPVTNPESSPRLTQSDRAAFVRRIKAVLAA